MNTFLLIIQIACYVLAVICLALAIYSMSGCDGISQAKRYAVCSVALALLGSAPFVVSLFKYCFHQINF